MGLVNLEGNHGQLNGWSLITVTSRCDFLCHIYKSNYSIEYLMIYFKLLTTLQDMKFLNQLPWKERADQDLLVLPTDAALFEDPAFKVTTWARFVTCEDRTCIPWQSTTQFMQLPFTFCSWATLFISYEMSLLSGSSNATVELLIALFIHCLVALTSSEQYGSIRMKNNHFWWIIQRLTLLITFLVNDIFGSSTEFSDESYYCQIFILFVVNDMVSTLFKFLSLLMHA